jgi:hypothetical protein
MQQQFCWLFPVECGSEAVSGSNSETYPTKLLGLEGIVVFCAPIPCIGMQYNKPFSFFMYCWAQYNTQKMTSVYWPPNTAPILDVSGIGPPIQYQYFQICVSGMPIQYCVLYWPANAIKQLSKSWYEKQYDPW